MCLVCYQKTSVSVHDSGQTCICNANTIIVVPARSEHQGLLEHLLELTAFLGTVLPSYMYLYTRSP